MSDTVHGIRQKTKEQIEQQRYQSEVELASLKEKSQKTIEKIIGEQEEKYTTIQKQIARDAQNQHAAIHKTHKILEQKIEKESEEINRNLESLKTTAAKELEKYKQQTDEIVDEAHHEIDNKLDALLQKIKSQEVSAQTTANEKISEAKEKIRNVSCESAVLQFKSEMLDALHVLELQAESEYEKHNWMAAASIAVHIIRECNKCVIDASRQQTLWNNKVENVRKKLDKLYQQLNIMSEKETIRVADREWEGYLKSWNIDAYDELAANLNEIACELKDIPVNKEEILTRIDTQISVLIIERIVEKAVESVRLSINAYILACIILESLEDNAGAGWEESCGGEATVISVNDSNKALSVGSDPSQYASYGSLALKKKDSQHFEELIANVQVLPEALRAGKYQFSLRLSYHGTQSFGQLANKLIDVIDEYKYTLGKYNILPSIGGLDIYHDNDDRPACNLDLQFFGEGTR